MTITGAGGANGFDPAQMAQAIFKKLDANSDGGISKSELQSAMKRSGSNQNIDKIFSEADKNGDGKIDSTENESQLKKMGAGSPPPGVGGPPPGGSQASAESGAARPASSATTTQASDDLRYDKQDLNKDGTVTIQEEIQYALQHPAEATKSKSRIDIVA